MKRNNMIDERVLSQVHQFGYQARNIMSVLLALDLVYKIFIMNYKPEYWVTEAVIFIAGFSWYIIRCSKAGLLMLPEQSKQKRRLLLQMVITGFITGLIFVVSYILFRTPSQQTGILQTSGYILLGLGILLILYFSIIWILTKTSLHAMKNKMEE